MLREKSLAFILSFIGLIFIVVNGVWIGINNAPIIIATDASLTTVQTINNSTAFWGRISFGVKGAVEGFWTPFWFIFVVALCGCVIGIYRKPTRHHSLGIPIIVFSFLSLPIGGGFLVGMILSFIGGMLAIEWPKPFSQTIIGKMIRTARLDSKIFRQTFREQSDMKDGTIALLLTSIFMGFGNALYVFNQNLIKTKTAEAYNILLGGSLYLETITITTALSFIGIAFLRWLAISAIFYFIMVKLKGYELDFNKLGRAVMFAFTPLCLQGFLPVLFSNEPYLSLHWPLAILSLSTLWVILAFIAFIKSMFQIQIREALGVVILTGVLYFLLEIIVSSNSLISIPGVKIQFSPESSSAILLFTSLTIFLAVLLGALTPKRQG
jgi:hypothetical protein